MTKKKLFAIFVPVAITIGFSLFLANSYDFTPSTKDNPYGLEARVVKTIWNPSVTGPPEPTETTVGFRLYFDSKKPIEYIGHNICSGIFCVLEGLGEQGSVRLRFDLGDNMRDWDNYNIPGYPWWNAGDTANIRIKVKPATLLENGTIVRSNGETTFIDLGESQILEWEFGGSERVYNYSVYFSAFFTIASIVVPSGLLILIIRRKRKSKMRQ